MTNFDYLKEDPQFQTFASVAVNAEKVLPVDPSASVINCRRSMELAVKWMYSVDEDLVMPYQDSLVSLMHTDEFEGIVPRDIWARMDFVRRMGNIVAHTSRKITKDQAILCLKNLFLFFDFVAYCYAKTYHKHTFREELLRAKPAEPAAVPSEIATPVLSSDAKTVELQKLLAENKALKAELTERRKANPAEYIVDPLNLTEFKTRKIYIDTMLQDVGWTEGTDWLNEVELSGMPNSSNVGYADYVLYDDTMRPLAVIEAKKTCVDVSKGRQQAKLYADLLEKKYKRRPVIFLTNGFETRIIDGQYPERTCAAIYSKRDLEKWFVLQSIRTPLSHYQADAKIAGRYYQKAAVKSVCEAFDKENKRKALLVMATGSGKTRTVIALCKILLDAGWVKNILFLADRTALVLQAKRSFVNLLPTLSCSNLTDANASYSAHCILSTYQTMINLIDDAKDDQGKIFSCGHFDLVICDEAHRSIYNKYKDIFHYFDAPLVGLTATPKDDIDKNTYALFGLEEGVPTYGYDLAQAVKDHYLVDFQSVETKLKFLDEGITYDELSDAEKEEYEKFFTDEEGNMPKKIDSSALNSWLFNKDTIARVLHILMTMGLKVDSGENIGKTIIFAKNHQHAERICDIFHQLYPTYPSDYAKVIDNKINYVQSAIDEFSNPTKLPQIAISVDMLDTGIDIPEILNLVFFKKVLSKAKFWQMIGRGTRLCLGLIDGRDKTKFYIFDFCGNFEFFRISKGREAELTTTLQGTLFQVRFHLVYKLQDLTYQTPELTAFRKQMVEDLCSKVNELNRENFAVRQHIKLVDTYSKPENYKVLTYEDCLQVDDDLAPLMLPDTDDVKALRFDSVIYHMELAKLRKENTAVYQVHIAKQVAALTKLGTIQEVIDQKELIQQILHSDFLEKATILDLERIRKELRGLMKYIQHTTVRYDTNFTDTQKGLTVHDPELENTDLDNYKAKVEHYITSHQDTDVFAKLKTNRPLTQGDFAALEDLLWNKLGTKEDYVKTYQDQSVGALVRSIIGLDMEAAKEAFAVYLNDKNLNSAQIYFLNQVVEYINKNGMLTDLRVLQDSPFTDRGSISSLFKDHLNLWEGIKKTIREINENATYPKVA